MIKIKNHKQINLFDPWEYISPKRRKILDESWSGLFQKEVLPSLPIDKVVSHFHNSFGRPTKELHTVLGVLVLQQAFDLTDIETVEQFAFNLQWHYALNITEESDSAKYICPKTLWNMRTMVATDKLDNLIFNDVTGKLAEVFKVNSDTQRLDSTHIKSNMRRLGRLCIFTETIHKFLVNLKRGHKELFDTIDQKIADKYLTEKALGCFSRVKPSDSRKTLNEVSRDLFDLVQQFKGDDEVTAMHSYKQLERVLTEHCNLTGSDDHPIEMKPPKQIPSDSLQNPSDPDATYSGHKGQGYQVQIMETYSKEEKGLNLITHVEVEPAHKSDAHALIPAIESVQERNLAPQELLADSLYGSDENSQGAKRKGVDLISPVMGAQKQKGVCLSDFKVSENGLIRVCPQGEHPVKTKRKKNRLTAAFNSQKCQCCPHRSQCPVKKGKKFYYLRYTNKDLRIAQRRAYEETPEFKDCYRWRSGIEGTISEYDRRTGVKHLRVRGLKAVRFSATLKALALNIFRAAALRLALEGKKEPSFATGLVCPRLISIVKERFSAFMQILEKICNQFFEDYFFNPIWVK
jgi:hypothetical protein